MSGETRTGPSPQPFRLEDMGNLHKNAQGEATVRYLNEVLWPKRAHHNKDEYVRIKMEEELSVNKQWEAKEQEKKDSSVNSAIDRLKRRRGARRIAKLIHYQTPQMDAFQSEVSETLQALGDVVRENCLANEQPTNNSAKNEIAVADIYRHFTQRVDAETTS